MWLKINFNEEDIVKWSINPKKICVSIIDSDVAPINNDGTTFRLSPIFPLAKDFSEPNLAKTNIYFFNFQNAYRVLGRVDKLGTVKLKRQIFFSLGLSSIMIISNDNTVLTEFEQIKGAQEYSYETWEISDSVIQNIDYAIIRHETVIPKAITIIDYGFLPVTERALVDEFHITINLLLPKLVTHMPTEFNKIFRLIEEVNELITEIVFLHNLQGEVPNTLSEYTTENLREPKLNQIIKLQNLDRIIQINSALSYISTQAFSGAIPILERRSLIRRNSLLGIGSSILALNNIARFIEESFSKISFDDIITNLMSLARPLPGLTNFIQYESTDWFHSSIDKFADRSKQDIPYYKLPYFSGRLGFRETQYSIAAAIQSVTSGSGLEWSLMTLTHEMLHGHVRNIISAIFFGKKTRKPEDLKPSYYSTFRKHAIDKVEGPTLIDSVRNIFLAYCCMTVTMGSLTSKVPYTAEFQIGMPDNEDDLWQILENENRNISEIMVHILDLHYFYASRVSIYIPLIWCSWISVPHINGDIRQYILRSLLSISSKESGDTHTRFEISVVRFKDILEQHVSDKLNFPAIYEIIKILNDTHILMSDYFPAFKSSIIIVDLVKLVFVSGKIRGNLFNDEFVNWKKNEKDEGSFEDDFEYDLTNDFNDEKIQSPLAFLLDRMIKVLKNKEKLGDLERETTMHFLALNSSF